MSHSILIMLGLASGILNTLGAIPYYRDIFRHRTKPERATWWVWTALLVAALVAQIQAGATWSLGLTVSGLVVVGGIAVLSLRYGYGRFHRRDTISLFIAALGIGVAQIINSPLFAISVIIAVDAVGFWLTLSKTWVAPHSETLISWQMAILTGALSTLAVGTWDIAQLLYPAYSAIAGIVIVVVIIQRRSVVKHDAQDIPPDSILA